MTTTARPLLHALALLGVALVGTWAGLALFSTLWVGVILFTILISYFGLVTGLLAIPRAEDPGRPEKVFCIGFSRTGTTSLSVALHDLGYAVYHMPFKLIHWPDGPRGESRVNPRWADAYDAQTDTPVAIVYRELAELYPTARFVLTTREAQSWGASVASFYGRYHTIFRYAPLLPTHRILSAAYGEDWGTKSPQDYAKIYERHVEEVRAFFAGRGQSERLLELAVLNGEGWPQLAAHLGCEPPPGADFPHIDVFDLTWNKQPWWQLQNLLERWGFRKR